MHTLLTYISPSYIIGTLGLIGVILVIFAETGLFVGFFLPGDSLLFTAGLFASQGHISIIALCIGTWIAAIVGDSVGYSFGKMTGPKLFSREDSRLFKKKHLIAAQTFYEKYGPRAIVFARFIPILRTFAPIVAGVAGMNYRLFLIYNIIGGTIWTIGFCLLGYFIGNSIPNVANYLTPILIGIIAVSFIPMLWPAIRRLFKPVV